MAADFKLNFNPDDQPEKIDALHERVAKRIHHLCVTNGGLYIKLAQSLAIQGELQWVDLRIAPLTTLTRSRHPTEALPRGLRQRLRRRPCRHL